MILKWIFDRVVALIGLLVLWPVLLIVAVLVKVKMPGGPAFFVQKRVGKDGELFDCHKFRTMTVKHNGSTVSVAGDSRITPLGAKLRHWKLDELPGLWDVLRGKMSFVGPRPDVPGYADKLFGSDRDVLKLRPGITGPATLKYRLEDEMLRDVRRLIVTQISQKTQKGVCAAKDKVTQKARKSQKDAPVGAGNGSQMAQNSQNFNVTQMAQIIDLTEEEIDGMTDQELAVWYNDHVIYPDKVRLNCYYYRHYSFVKDIQMIVCTVLGKRMAYAGEVI